MRYLDDYGLTPGAVVNIIKREPFDGPLELDVAGRSITLGYKIAMDILVSNVE